MSRDVEIARLLARIEELESIVENSPDIISRFDRQLRHVYVNRAIEAAAGMTADDFRGKTHAELGMPDELTEPWREVYRQVFATGQEGRKEFEFPGPDGVRSYVSRVVPERDADGNVVSILSVARDVTDSKLAEQRRLETERRLQEANKLESLGLLAGGIAHDFNNLLTGVLASASLLLVREPTPELTRVAAARIEQSAERAADLCRQLLAYAGRAQIASREVDVGDVASRTIALVAASVPRSVRLEIEREDAGHVVVGDPVQLQQVIMNLVLNAAEAIGEQTGRVRVTARVVPAEAVPREGRVVGPDDATGNHLHIAVVDDGRGMDKATLSRIFEPFFTTHFHGRGLGLAAVLGTVRAHGGTLRVTSTPGAGTTFDLYFPASARRESIPDSTPPRAPLRAFDGTRMLIVDDEPQILEATTALARSVGIVPLTVPSGRAALEHLRGSPEVDVVLLDLTMPDLDGAATLRGIREAHPHLPVVLMSGFAEAEALGAAGQQRVSGFLSKPFGLTQLVAALTPVFAAR